MAAKSYDCVFIFSFNPQFQTMRICIFRMRFAKRKWNDLNHLSLRQKKEAFLSIRKTLVTKEN